MNWQRIKNDWSTLSAVAAERWPKLDRNELHLVAGNRTTLMKLLQSEYGMTLEDAGVEVDRWADTVSEHGTDDVD